MNSDIRKMTPLEAVAELRQFDHAFISEEGCKAFHFAFGQPEYGGTTYRASPNEPKGLTLKDGAKEAVGMDAVDLACRICSLVGCSSGFAQGRGFRLRQACDNLEQYWSSETGIHHAKRIAMQRA